MSVDNGVVEDAVRGVGGIGVGVGVPVAEEGECRTVDGIGISL